MIMSIVNEDVCRSARVKTVRQSGKQDSHDEVASAYKSDNTRSVAVAGNAGERLGANRRTVMYGVVSVSARKLSVCSRTATAGIAFMAPARIRGRRPPSVPVEVHDCG